MELSWWHALAFGLGLLIGFFGRREYELREMRRDYHDRRKDVLRLRSAGGYAGEWVRAYDYALGIDNRCKAAGVKFGKRSLVEEIRDAAHLHGRTLPHHEIEDDPAPVVTKDDVEVIGGDFRIVGADIRDILYPSQNKKGS